MSENMNTPERIKRTAEAASHLYGSDFSAEDHPAMLNRPTDMKLSKEERVAFANPPFSEAQIKKMSKQYEKQRSELAATLSPSKMDTFEETSAMKRGEDTDMNIDGRTTPPPSIKTNPFATPERKGGRGHMYPALKNYIKRSKKKSKKSKKSKKNSKKKSKKKSIKARRRNKKSKKSKK